LVEGSRNTNFFTWGCVVKGSRGKGYLPFDLNIEEMILFLNKEFASPPLKETKIASILNSIDSYEGQTENRRKSQSAILAAQLIKQYENTLF
jgi:hypothetical protein